MIVKRTSRLLGATSKTFVLQRTLWAGGSSTGAGRLRRDIARCIARQLARALPAASAQFVATHSVPRNKTRSECAAYADYVLLLFPSCYSCSSNSNNRSLCANDLMNFRAASIDLRLRSRACARAE